MTYSGEEMKKRQDSEWGVTIEAPVLSVCGVATWTKQLILHWNAASCLFWPISHFTGIADNQVSTTDYR